MDLVPLVKHFDIVNIYGVPIRSQCSRSFLPKILNENVHYPNGGNVCGYRMINLRGQRAQMWSKRGDG